MRLTSCCEKHPLDDNSCLSWQGIAPPPAVSIPPLAKTNSNRPVAPLRVRARSQDACVSSATAMRPTKNKCASVNSCDTSPKDPTRARCDTYMAKRSRLRVSSSPSSHALTTHQYHGGASCGPSTPNELQMHRLCISNTRVGTSRFRDSPQKGDS